MADLPNSHLIEVANAAHGLRWNQPDIAEAWAGFLAGRTPKISKATADPIRFTLPSGLEPDVPEGTATVTQKELAACVGKYRFANGMQFHVVAVSNRLVATIPGKGKFNLWPKSGVSYTADNPNIPPLTFVKDKSGKVTAVAGGGKKGERFEK